MDNKEVVDRLMKYYLENDPKVVARCLANAILDFHRLVNLDKLPLEECECLQYRILQHEKELMKFIKNGPEGELKLKHVTKKPKE